MIVIEGSDQVGKSILAERVAQAHGWPVVTIRWALAGDAKAETFGMANATIELLAATTPDLILDRSYFSMWAYGEEVSYLPELIGRFDHVIPNRDQQFPFAASPHPATQGVPGRHPGGTRPSALERGGPDGAGRGCPSLVTRMPYEPRSQ